MKLAVAEHCRCDNAHMASPSDQDSWRSSRQEHPILVSGEVYPNDVAGQKPCESKKRGREGVPPGHDVASWRRVGKELYPLPAHLNEGTVSKWYCQGAAGFAAAAADPRKAWELPRLGIQ